MATPPTAATQQDIQNSEKLLDLSNQLIDSINERKKLLKGITAEEQLYLSTVKQSQKLSQEVAANAEKYLGYQIKSKDLAKQIKAEQDNFNKSNQAFNSIENKLSQQRADSLNKMLSLRKETQRQQDIINKLDEKNAELQILKREAERNGNVDLAKNIQNRIKENERIANGKEKYIKSLQVEFDKQKDIAKTAREIIQQEKEAQLARKAELDFLERNLYVRKQIEKSTGLLGGLSKALSKIPGIGQYLNADEAIDEMEKLAAAIEESGQSATSFGNRLKIGLKGASVLTKGLIENLKSPEAIFTFIASQALKANSQVVELGKSLGYGVGRADKFRENLATIARFSTNINVTTANLVQAYGELVKETGLAYEFTEDQLVTQVKLTKQVGLQANEAAQIQRLAVLNGKTSEETYKSFVKGLVATRNQLKVGIDLKAALIESANVSGQLAANLGYNPERIAKAVVTAKAFGMTLEQVAKSGEDLLNWESSIEKELKAELLTGKELNLERARAAALSGDQVTLAEELAKNVGTAKDFAKMNVLQQNALAESMGMTTDELANTLRKREEAIASGKSLAQITEEEAQQALERQDIQTKFNESILKLQDFFGNLVAGPVGQLLDTLTRIIGVVTDVLQPVLAVVFTPITWALGALGKMEGLLKSIAGVYLIIKGFQIASNVLEAGKTAQLALQGNALAIQNIMLEKSIVKKTMYHAIAIREAITEGGIAGVKAYALSLDEKSLARRTIMAAINAKEWAWEKGKAAWKLMQLGYERTSIALKRVASAIEKGNLLKSIGSAMMGVVESLSSIPIVGWALGLAAAAGVMALGYKFLSGDDVMSEGGYGKRTLLAPEGAIKLNDKDTVIAGTDLGGGGGGGASIDLTPMIAAINEVKAAIDRLYNKDTTINMDGNKVGTTLSQNSYKMA
jgi:hypothetical protein